MTENKKPKPKELFNEISKHPAYVNELTEYQKSKVLEYVANQIDQCAERAMKLLSADYNYPDDVEDDKKGDYWLNRSSKYKKAKRVKHIIENHPDVDQDQSKDNNAIEPWDQLEDEDVKNRILSFISGRSYKSYYKFLLSVFELNRDSLQNKNNTAAVELAENQSWYKNISDEPKTKKMKRELIRDYKAEYNER